MSHRTNRWAALLLAASVPALAGVAAAQDDTARATREQLVDLTFPGGAAVAYVEAVRRAAGDLNVMISPHLKDVPVQPVELKRVSVEAALTLLEGRYTAGGRTMDVDVEVNHAELAGAMDVYRLEARVRPEPAREDASSGVWSLSGAIEGGLAPEAVLTAIETALDLYDKAYAPAQLRFHRESGLLIARAHPEQIQTITLILDRLSDPGARDAQALEAAEQRMAELEDKLHQRTSELDGLHRELIEIATKSQMLERQMDGLQGERRELQKQLVATQMDRDITVNRLQMEIQRLLDAAEGREEP